MQPKSIIDNAQQRKDEKKEFAVHFGKYLRKVREERGMKQEELSEKAGYYRTYVGKIEQGQYSPSIHTIWRLTHVLGITLEEFFRKFK